MSTAPTKTNGAAALAKSPTASLEAYLQANKETLAKALPTTKGLSPDKFIKLTLLAARKNPDLLRCDLGSVFQCLVQCAELGLEPSGSLGAAYLIPFEDRKNNKTVCTVIIGYRGLIDLARRSGVLIQIEAHVVYATDTFTYRIEDEGTRLQHVPTIEGDPGHARAVYCIVRLASGGRHIEVMSVRQVEDIRQKAPGKNSPAWREHWDEMAKKTVARRALKWVPMSSELQKALDMEDEHDVGGGQSSGAMSLGSLEVRAPKVPASSPAGRAANGRAAQPPPEDAEFVEPTTGEVLSEPPAPAPAETERQLSQAEKDIELFLTSASSAKDAMKVIPMMLKLPTAELKAYWKERYNERVRGWEVAK